MMRIFGIILIASIIVSCILGPEGPEGNGYQEDWLAITNLDGSDPQWVCQCGGNGFFIPDPDNPENEVIIGLDSHKLVKASIDGSEVDTLLYNPDETIGYEHARLSSLKDKIVFKKDANVYIFDFSEELLSQATYTNGHCLYPAFSPDGTEIVFIERKTSTDSVYYLRTLNLITNISEDVVVTNDDDYICFPIFTDGNKICYVISKSVTTKVCLIDRMDSSVDTVYTGYAGPIEYNSSTDQILFKSDPDLVILQLGSGSIAYIDDLGIAFFPLTWSDSGNYILVGNYLYNVIDGSVSTIDHDIDTYSRNGINQTESKLVRRSVRNYSY